MKVYLDMCAIQRPLDTRSQVRIAVEAEATIGIIASCESGALDLISSDALLFEMRRNPNPMRKKYAWEVLAHAKIFVPLTAAVEKRADGFNALGIKPLDALHLASAEIAEADYFCTCDDRLLKNAKSIKGLMTKVVSPPQLIQEIQT